MRDPYFDRHYPSHARVIPIKAKNPWLVIESANAWMHFQMFLVFMVISVALVVMSPSSPLGFFTMILSTFGWGGGVIVETRLSAEHQRYYVP